jgi:diadenosine tetraphosphate (Ap4A) HIT family hydrolase
MSGCIFCKIVAGSAPAHRVYEDEHFLAFLDIYPVRPGHTLVIPRQHGQFLSDFEPSQSGELFALGQRLGGAIRRSPIPCEDINFVLNDGPAANQTVPHVHLHLVPRTRKDLHKVAAVLARRPIQPLLGAASPGLLERQAEQIRSAIW